MFAAIFLPHFRLQAALRFREELWAQSIALVDEQSGKGLILDVTPPAAAAGVSAGLTSPQAMARCPELRLLPQAVAQEKNAAAVLLEIAGSLSPDFEATADGIVTVDVSRAKISDWSRWAAAVVERLATLQLRARIGLAANPDLALLAARRAGPVLVVQNAATFLADIAIAEVDPSPELVSILRDWGIGHLGQLAQVPKDALIDRLGPAAGELWQRAMGGKPRLLRLVRPVEEFVETFDFEHEIETVEPLLFVLRRFLDQLARRLAGAYRVAARMVLTLLLEKEGEYTRTFTIPAPTVDVEVLFRILHTHLDGLTLAQCPTGLRLSIEPVCADHRQLRLFESPLRDPNRFGETLARLSALVGAERVGVPQPEDTHRPDRFRVVEPRFHTVSEEKSGAPDLAVGLPLRRYRPAFPAQVQLVRHTPAFVFSEKIHGEIVEAAGPYRLSGDWWESERWSAEEWDAEMSDGALIRLAKRGDSWFLEGSYDGAVC
jgi:protein ImuB